MAKRILVIQTAFLGDLLLAIPLLKQIRLLWSEHHIDLVCRKGLGSVLTHTGLVQECFEIEKGKNSSYKHVLEALSQRHYDLVFSPHQSFRTALFVSKIKADKKVSFKSWWNFPFFDLRIAKRLELPEALRELQLLSDFSAELKVNIEAYLLRHANNWTGKKKDLVNSLPMLELDAVPKWASCILDNFRPTVKISDYSIAAKFIAIFPGSVWPTKQWTEAGFYDLVRILATQGKQIVLLGSANEFEFCDRISAIASAKPGQIVNLAGKTKLLETLSLLREAEVVISNDSGGQHLAALFNLPVVSIFGPTIPSQGFRPWADRAVIVQQSLSCRPCGRHGHKECPLGTHACMTSILPEQILYAMDALKKMDKNEARL